MVILDQVADSYRPPSMHIGDPEKYYWPKVMARFEKYGQRDSLGNAWIEALKDRSPFHFTLVGMARILYLYPESPALREHQRTILKRVFERTDSYNAWTGEGTENHTNMARCSGFLHAQKALDFPDEFPEARMRYEQMKE